MTIKSHLILIVCLSFLIVSCNSRKTEEKLADQRLSHIVQLINDNSLNTAKIQIDSVHLLFPRLVAKRKIAASYSDTIIRRESAHTLAYCDSILPIKQHELDSIQKNFRFEKNAKYQAIGNYVYKTQITESNSNRTYLKTYVDENSDFYLISNYCGAKIEHTSVEVSANDLFANSDIIPISDAANHSFNDAGMHWEAVTFKNKADNGVAAFITQNSNLQIKVTLHGKKAISYYLANTDKKAIVETFNLWIVKKDVSKLQTEIKKATIKIERIRGRQK
ncbi:MAG: hypothetical protein WCG93_07825 [Paludibacter sp.]